MRIRLLFTFILLLSFRNVYSQHLVQDCTILDMDGKIIKVLPGKMCLFLDNGSFVSGDAEGLSLYDKNKKVLWDIRGHFHHQLAFSPDKKRILAISSDKNRLNGKDIRTDKFMVISVDGRVLHELKSESLIEWTKQKWHNWDNSPWLRVETHTDKEISHFNSIYEIPENAGKEILKPGHYIINGLSHGIFILTPDLKKLTYHKIFPHSNDHFIHDVQVTKHGTMIYFNNIASPSDMVDTYSAIQEFDPSTNKVTFEYTSQPKNFFFSRYCGSVQELNDDKILFSDKFNGTFIYSRKSKALIKTLRGTHFQNKLPVFVQHIKAYDLSGFLKLNQ